jgi:tetratricopeptide (TPR) repeat protein
VVFHKVDAEKGDGAELAEEFKVPGYPTFVAVNSEGETIQRWAGYDSAESFIETVARIVADPTTIDEKIARFESAPTAEDAVTLGEFHATSGQWAEAADYFERALGFEDADPDLAYDAFFVYSWGYSEEAFSTEQLTAAADRAMDSDALSAKQHLYLARVMSKAAGDDAEWSAAPYIERALAETQDIDDPELESARRLVLIEQALRVTGDKNRAVELKRETYPEGWEEDAEALNSFAWWCFENKVNLEEAETLARRGVDLASDDDEKAMILDTLAEIVFLRGDAEGATTLIRDAMALSPDSDYYKEQLVKFGGEPSNVM